MWPGCVSTPENSHIVSSINIIATSQFFKEQNDNLADESTILLLKKIKEQYETREILDINMYNLQIKQTTINKYLNYLIQILPAKYQKLYNFTNRRLFTTEETENFQNRCNELKSQNLEYLPPNIIISMNQENNSILPQNQIILSGIAYNLKSIVIKNHDTNQYVTFIKVRDQFYYYDNIKNGLNEINPIEQDSFYKDLENVTTLLYTSFEENFDLATILESQQMDSDFNGGFEEFSPKEPVHDDKDEFVPFENIAENGKKSLSDFIKVGKIYTRDELYALIDKSSFLTNKNLYCKDNFQRFRYKCHSCDAHVTGSCNILDNTIIISVVKDHSETCDSEYRPLKQIKKNCFNILDIHEKSVSIALEKRASYYQVKAISERTALRYIAKSKLSTKSDELQVWQHMESFIKQFNNEKEDNTIIVKNKVDDHEYIEYFLILPKESIAYMNSDQFSGFFIIDSTFIPDTPIQFLGIVTLNWNHKITPIAFGCIPTENSSFLIPMFTVVYNGFDEYHKNALKLVISDSGSGLCKAIETVFASSVHRRCILHKGSNLKQSIRSFFFKALRAATQVELQDLFTIEAPKYTNNNEETAELIELIKSYSPFFRSGPSQGMLSSSCCESFNSLLKASKNQNIMECCIFTYSLLREQLQNSDFDNGYSAYIADQIRKYQEYVDQLNIRQLTHITFEVHDPIDNSVFHTNNHIKSSYTRTNRVLYVKYENSIFTCSCNMEKEKEFGCFHIYGVCKKFNICYTNTINEKYKQTHIETWLNVIKAFPSTDYDNLELDSNITMCYENDEFHSNHKRKLCSIDYVKGGK